MKLSGFYLIPCLALAGIIAQASPAWDEATALAALASGNEEKARACQVLAVVGGPDTVPALAELLGDNQLASYARTALEVIEDPSAGEALRAALTQLEGRYEAALPALQALATDTDREVAASALAALAQIGSENALATVVQTLQGESEELRITAAHATLAAAERMAKDGKTEAARDLLESVQKADLPEHIRKAATTALSSE
ncbi:MAG: hypothetical protein F7O42_12005 [Opitutae bacterium]|nr:hypothetical protein [Opitutae bacterium]